MRITFKKASFIAVVTFGNKQFFKKEAGEDLLFNFVLHENDSFTVVQSGLNYYVVETQSIAKMFYKRLDTE